MSIEWSERQLRDTGDPGDAAYANVLRAILDARGADVDLPSVTGMQAETDGSERTPLNPHIVHHSGMLALNDGSFTVPAPEKHAKESVWNLELMTGVNTITAPYTEMFVRMMPGSDTNRRDLLGAYYNVGAKAAVIPRSTTRCVYIIVRTNLRTY
jgi:hypothetical protein